MIKFFLKKSFFDGWDNFPSLLVRNTEYAVLGILYFFVVQIPAFSGIVPFYLISLVFLFLFCCLNLGNFGIISYWASPDGSEHTGFFTMLKNYLKHLLLFLGIIILAILSVTLLIPFYFSMDSILGYVLGVILFWVVLLLILPLQFFFPLSLLENDTPINTMKKCMKLAVSNKAFTIFLTIKSLLESIASIVTILLIPGITGIGVSQFDAAILLLLRNNYMKQNSLFSKKEIDYKELFREEDEKLGKRNLGSIISPWKNR